MELLARKSIRELGVLCSLFLFVLMSACAGSNHAPDASLDPVTGVTVRRAAKPVVFYRDNSGQAAYARDYIYLGPVAVNRMGDYQYYLWLVAWSTHAGGADAVRRRDDFESITIIADGEPLPLEVVAWTANSIGSSEDVYDKPVASAVEAYYAVTLDQIRLLAQASDIRIHPSALQYGSYEPWSGARGDLNSLRGFVEELR